MKKTIGILFLSIIMLTTISFAAYPADLEAAELEQLETTNLDDMNAMSQPHKNIDDTIIVYDDIYKMENDVTIKNVVDGNVYLMGRNVKVEDATIYGNLYVMAEKIEIVNSDIGGSTYAIGEEILFSSMTNDLYAVGSNIKLTESSSVWRTVKLSAKDLNLSGYIGRDIYAGIQNLTVSEDIIIEGKLNYYSQNEGNIAPNAQIGEVHFGQEKTEEHQENPIMEYVYEIANVVFKTLIVALIMVFLVHKFTTLSRTENIATDLLKAMGKGAGVLVVAPIIALVLMCTIIGIALGFSVLAIYIVLLYIATAIIALEIAYRILARNQAEEVKKGKLIGLAVLIAIVIWAIGFIPAVGNAVKFILILMGLGILFDLLFQKAKKQENMEK